LWLSFLSNTEPSKPVNTYYAQRILISYKLQSLTVGFELTSDQLHIQSHILVLEDISSLGLTYFTVMKKIMELSAQTTYILTKSKLMLHNHMLNLLYVAIKYICCAQHFVNLSVPIFR
jgi:hypothetical protein